MHRCPAPAKRRGGQATARPSRPDPLGIQANGRGFPTIGPNAHRGPRLRRPPPARLLQTGTGTAQTTAISTAAITAVIFSLVDRSMASPGAVPISAPPYTRPGCSRCDVDHAPTGCLSRLSPRPLVGFGRDHVDLAPNPAPSASATWIFSTCPRPGFRTELPRVASKLARPQRFFNYLRMLTATSR